MAADERTGSFEEFVSARWTVLYRTAYLMTGRAADAEDLLQATFVKAYAAWGRVQRADSPEAYVRKMLVNGFISTQRRRKRERDHAAAQRVPAPSPTHEAGVLDRVGMWEHVANLPPRQRAVVVLRFYEDLSEQQVAHVLGCAPGTVKSQTHDALRSLRARVTDQPDAEGSLR
jgi:RNA polymerase sigma-70 factor (sigma-E family)